MNIFTDDATGPLINRIELARQSIAAAGGMVIGSASFVRDRLIEAKRLKDKEFQRTLELLIQLATPDQIKELHDRLDELQKRLDEEFEALEEWREDMDRRIALGVDISEEEQVAYNRRAEQLAEIQTDIVDAGRSTLENEHISKKEAEALQEQITNADSILDNNPTAAFAEVPKTTPPALLPKSLIFDSPSV